MGIFDTLASPLASIGGGIASSAMGMYEAQQNRNFQENMANTTHQREVADLKKAGLNPILSAKLGGNPAPSGSMPSIPDMSSLGNTVTSAKQTSSQVEMNNAQIRKTNADAAVQEQTAKNLAQTSPFLNQNEITKNLLLQQNLKAGSVSEDPDYIHAAIQSKVNEGKSSAYSLSQQKAESDFYNTKFGKAAPYVNAIENAANSAGALIHGYNILQHPTLGR